MVVDEKADFNEEVSIVKNRKVKNAYPNVSKTIKDKVHDTLNVIENAANEVAYSAESLVNNIINKGKYICHYELPDWLRDNEFIIQGHRPIIPSFKRCFKTMFRVHTETGNIWTHFIGLIMILLSAVIFYICAISFAYYQYHEIPTWIKYLSNLIPSSFHIGFLSNFTESLLIKIKDKMLLTQKKIIKIDITQAILEYSPYDLLSQLEFGEYFIVGSFFVGASVCLLFSWLFHTLFCHSLSSYKIFSKLDYTGICLLIVGSYIQPIFYGFYCDIFVRNLYLSIVLTLGLSCFSIMIFERFSKPKYRSFRASLFVALGLFSIIPLSHSIIVDGFESALVQTAMDSEMLMGFLYITGAVLYSLRIPERLSPKAFNFWFQSHQIFHILVVISIFIHYHAVMRMIKYRNFVGRSCEFL